MKKCWICKSEKDCSEFYNDRHSVDGKQKACKVCQKTRNRKYNEAHKDYFKEKSCERYRKAIKNNPDYNKLRYRANTEDFVQRSKNYRSTPRGRLMTLLGVARDRAGRLSRDFEIDIDFVLGLYNKNEGRCCVTGIKLDLESKANGKRFYSPFTPSLDRIDSNKGYTKDNVRLVCAIVNLSVNIFGDEIFDKMCLEYMKKKHPDLLK